jgi:hypothetical protein
MRIIVQVHLSGKSTEVRKEKKTHVMINIMLVMVVVVVFLDI